MKQNKMDATTNKIAESSETGSTGILHLKRLWSKLICNSKINQTDQEEAALDDALLNLLGIGSLLVFQYVYQQNPSFEAFEQWVINHHNPQTLPSLVESCNALVKQEKINTADSNYPDVLTKEDLLHWQEYGYVIIRNSISAEDCKQTREIIWDFLGMEENNPDSWYHSHESIQGIMVNLFNHPVLIKNRHHPRIRKAYEQIWGSDNLIVTADKVGFNPPETATYQYRGTGLHWDTSLSTPIPFGTQGILYLTDTAANQGALTLVPSFHNDIHQWLQALPPEKNPREENLAAFGAKPIAANAGDFIIWHHCLPHGSSPNTADKPRLVQYINWFDPSVKNKVDWI